MFENKKRNTRNKFKIRIDLLVDTSKSEFGSTNCNATVEDIFCCFIIIFICCSLLTQTLGYRGLNVRVLSRRFNYVIASKSYYTQVLIWIFNVTFCTSISPFCFDTDGSYSLYSTHLTRSEFWVPARGIAYTNITHNVIPLSLGMRCFPKSEDDLFLQPVHHRSTRTIINHINFSFSKYRFIRNTNCKGTIHMLHTVSRLFSEAINRYSEA